LVSKRLVRSHRSGAQALRQLTRHEVPVGLQRKAEIQRKQWEKESRQIERQQAEERAKKVRQESTDELLSSRDGNCHFWLTITDRVL
jgi:hypothetical protein